jgi:ligand-binding sensor domain-containing protein
LGRLDAVTGGRTVSDMTAGVLALAGRDDTVWAGTVRGLAVYGGPESDLHAAPGAAAEPALRETIVALVSLGDTLVAATPDRIAWRGPTGRWVVERVMSPQLGSLRALAAGAGGVWVGGERGLGFFRFSGRDLTTWHVPDDIPGPVQDVALTARHVWVATPAGLVRFQLDALRP